MSSDGDAVAGAVVVVVVAADVDGAAHRHMSAAQESHSLGAA